MQTQLLIASGDVYGIRPLLLYLESCGCGVQNAANAGEIFNLLEHSAFDALILDLPFSSTPVSSLLQALRLRTGMAILIAGESIEQKERILFFDLGADDVLEKPLDPPEFLSRLNARLRRSQLAGDAARSAGMLSRLRYGALCLDASTLALTKNGTPVPITLAEYKILLTMMTAPGKVFSKRELYECINASASESGRSVASSDENTIMVHISKIREKIEDHPRNPRYIQTVRAQGYRFEFSNM